MLSLINDEYKSGEIQNPNNLVLPCEIGEPLFGDGINVYQMHKDFLDAVQKAVEEKTIEDTLNFLKIHPTVSTE